jgi:hypothetical protein
MADGCVLLKASCDLTDPANATVLGRVKRWVLAMLARKSELRVAPLPPLRGAFDAPCAPRPSEPVGTKGVPINQPGASGAGRTKGDG